MKNNNIQIIEGEAGEAGRPTKMTEEVVKKLVACFSNGFSDQLACDHVGITKQTLYNYCDKNPEFLTIKERLKKNPVAAATLNIVKAIDNGDVKASQWYLERKCKDEFSIRTEVEKKKEQAVKKVFITEKEAKACDDHIMQVINSKD
jgi:hypothetical protein